MSDDVGPVIKLYDNVSIATKAPPRMIVCIRDERWMYSPQRDIQPFEVAQLIELFFGTMNSCSGSDLDGWWDTAGPGIWRHFTSKDSEP